MTILPDSKTQEPREPQKWAFISVADKEGLESFAYTLQAFGYNILSSGGTSDFLAEHGYAVTRVSDISELKHFEGVDKPFLDGRVKTIVPQLYGGLLARDVPEHHLQLAAIGALWIDVVVVDVYPMINAIKQEGATLDAVIPLLDIGGPMALVAGTKGNRWVLHSLVARILFSNYLRGCENSPDDLRMQLQADAVKFVGAYYTAFGQFLEKQRQNRYGIARRT